MTPTKLTGRRIDRVTGEMDDQTRPPQRPPRRKSYEDRASNPRYTAAGELRKRPRDSRAGNHGRDWKSQVLAILADNGGCVTYAAQDVGISRDHVYRERQKDEDFALAMRDALDKSYESLVTEAHRRALAGSDLLIMFLMKGLHPEIWRDNYRLPASVELDEQQLAMMTSAIQNAMTESDMSDAQKRAFRESLEQRLQRLEGVNA